MSTFPVITDLDAARIVALGERREIRVLEMHYQPEAAGDPSR